MRSNLLTLGLVLLIFWLVVRYLLEGTSTDLGVALLLGQALSTHLLLLRLDAQEEAIVDKLRVFAVFVATLKGGPND